MSDAQQPHQGNLANPLVLALEISSSALLHVSKEPFLRAAMASIGESLHCEQVSLVEFDDEPLEYWCVMIGSINEPIENCIHCSTSKDAVKLVNLWNNNFKE